jgi:transcriptional regulator with XRE-family HTH domain
MTQSEIATHLGITKRQVINLEGGKSPIRRAYAAMLERAVIDKMSAPGASGLEEKDDET